MSESIAPVCVYCSSSEKIRPVFREAARALGRVLGERRLDLIYGGGRRGLMGDVADGALAAGGHVVGVITRQLVDMETAHHGLADLRIVETMHERKAQMAAVAKSFVALPGGVGTLDELFEILAWFQLGLHAKPIGILDTDGFFGPIMAFLENADAEGFLRFRPREAIVMERDPVALIERLMKKPSQI